MHRIYFILVFLFVMSGAGWAQDVRVVTPDSKTPDEVWRTPGPFPKIYKVEDEQEQEFMEFLKENDPKEYKELLELKEQNPERYHHEFRGRYVEVLRLEALKKHDPEKYELDLKNNKLERQSRTLAKQYRNSTDPQEQSRLRTELSAVLDELFVIREAEKENRIKTLEEELNNLRKLVAERKGKKEQIVQRRLSELLGETDTLRW